MKAREISVKCHEMFGKNGFGVPIHEGTKQRFLVGLVVREITDSMDVRILDVRGMGDTWEKAFDSVVPDGCGSLGALIFSPFEKWLDPLITLEKFWERVSHEQEATRRWLVKIDAQLAAEGAI